MKVKLNEGGGERQERCSLIFLIRQSTVTIFFPFEEESTRDGESFFFEEREKWNVNPHESIQDET